MNQGERATQEQVQAAQYQLGLVLGFFPRVDALLAALLGLNVAMLGVAFARAPAVGQFTSQQVVIALIYLALTAMSLRCLYRGSFPDTDGGVGSLVYFGEIAKLHPADYVERFGKQTEAELSRALLHQAWRNSCILSNKFQSLKIAYRWLLASVVPWAVALLAFPPVKGA
ncbi:Pycsar system effector family protein [Novilysobacter arseniciresistens]|uniref:Pycsar system effector family protein n=1 Tax=Novilysobacter arseniciresistens TaxID=1385522 RepID=UPI001269D98B|nr:Pycsar system effector family protein [Lysobacter arseniciresistens]